MTYGYEGGGGGGGRRLSLRLIAGLVIAVIGIITYFHHTETNPVTGEKQRVAMTVDQEKALGLEAAPQMANEMGGVLPENDPESQLVRAMGEKIVASSDAGKSPYVGNFHFHVIADPKTVNAFALPGGQVFITHALLSQLQNEAQLAGVLGHEIGHVIARHAAEHMAKGQLGQSLVTAVAVGASDDQRRGQMAAMAAMMANQMLQLHYSRDDELQADSLGLKYMSQTGYTPAAMLEVMEILKRASGGGGRGPSFMQTHPDPDARIAQIKEYLQKNFPNGVPSNLTEGKQLFHVERINAN
ncbi:MAG TPA: M48 family metalloprotease [Tepidisphaeraceae bacterium]|nr:M48 family metalloprotease [Tepidisphaeraceae bacterium]